MLHHANTQHQGIYHYIWDLNNPLLDFTNFFHYGVTLAFVEQDAAEENTDRRLSFYNKWTLGHGRRRENTPNSLSSSQDYGPGLQFAAPTQASPAADGHQERWVLLAGGHKEKALSPHPLKALHGSVFQGQPGRESKAPNTWKQLIA